MENKTKWMYWAIIGVLVILLLLQHGCQGDGDTKTTTTIKDVEVTVPGRDGVLTKPTDQTELPSSGKDSIVYYDKLVYVESKANQEAVDKYKSAKNEIDRLNVLLESTRQREYVSDFEDENISLKIHTKVFGLLDEVVPQYQIKPQKITVQEKTILKETTVSSKFALYAGVSAQSNTSMGNLAPGADISAQINNKTIISAGINTDKDITVGVKFRIFNINK